MAKELKGELPLGYLYNWEDFIDDFRPEEEPLETELFRPEVVSLSAALITKERVRLAHERGQKVAVWVSAILTEFQKDPLFVWTLADYGIDYYITDEPIVAIQTRDSIFSK